LIREESSRISRWWGQSGQLRGVKEQAGALRHRPIPVCRVQNCERSREVATRGRSGARRCDGRIFPGDGRRGGRGWRGCCEQRSPSLRVVRGPRGAGLGCKAKVRRRGGRRSNWGKTARRSAQRFRRGKRIRSARESRINCLSCGCRKGPLLFTDNSLLIDDTTCAGWALVA
jgi:hypothetical protein